MNMDDVVPEIVKGLSNEQAQKLFDEGYGNQIEDSTVKSTGRIIRENTLTFLIWFL